MTTYSDPFEQRFEAKIKDLARRLATAEQQIANAAMGAFPVTSTTHPAFPTTGMRIYETDTGLEAFWSGTAWEYPPQLIKQVLLTASQPSITINVPAGPNNLYGVYTARKDAGGGGAFTWMRFNGDSNAHYQWVNQIGNNAPGTSGPSLLGYIQMGLCAGASDTAGYFGTGTFLIGNSSSTSVAKSLCSTASLICNGTTYYLSEFGGVWNQAAAIASVTLLPDSGNLVANSSFALYGWT